MTKLLAALITAAFCFGAYAQGTAPAAAPAKKEEKKAEKK